MTNNTSRRASLRAAAIFFAVTTTAAGQELRLNELVSEALAKNPQILAAQKAYEAARQRPSQSAALPDPMFSPGYTSNGNPLPGAQLGSNPTSAIGFMISQEVPYPGKRQLRGQMAEKDAQAEFQSYQAVELNVVSRIKQAYYRLSYDYSALDVLTRYRSLLEKLLAITEARYSVGRGAQQDVFKAQTQISLLEGKRIALERDRAARNAEINSLANHSPGQPLGSPAELKPEKFPRSLDDLYAIASKQAPLLARGEKMIQKAELAVNLAHKDYFPDVTLAAGYFNQGSMSPMYQVRLDITLPVYYRQKQHAALTEQTQVLSQTRREYEAANQNLHFQIQDQYLLVDASWKLLELYGKTTVPQASLAFESSLASYEAGSVDFLSVLSNYMSVFDYEMNYYEELQNYYTALAQLEEMTGTGLIP